MKSLQFEDYGKELIANTYEKPSPTGKQVLIKIDACGVCHSDLHVWEGHFDLGGGNQLDMKGHHRLPFTLGHEIAGEVVAMGSDAQGTEVGSKCVVYPWIGCGKCPSCNTGQEHICNAPRAIGITVNGGYSDYVLVPDAKYLHELGDLPASLACTYACSGLTAYSALKRIKDQVKGRQLLLIGAGGVGLAGLAIAKAILDCEIIVSDIDPEKRAAALAGGAHQTIDPTDKEAVKQLLKSTKGGVSATVDFVGSDRSFGFALNTLNKGGTLVVVGLLGGAFPLSVPLIPLKSLTITGSYVGSPQDMSELMALAREGKIDPLVITERSLSNAQEALNDLQQGHVVGRVVLTPDQEE